MARRILDCTLQLVTVGKVTYSLKYTTGIKVDTKWNVLKRCVPALKAHEQYAFSTFFAQTAPSHPVKLFFRYDTFNLGP